MTHARHSSRTHERDGEKLTFHIQFVFYSCLKISVRGEGLKFAFLTPTRPQAISVTKATASFP